MKQSYMLIAAIGVAGFVTAGPASYAQNPFPDGPPARGQCVRACAQELGACLEGVGAALQACMAALETPMDIPMGVPDDVQVCLDAAELGRVGCKAEFNACVEACDENGPGNFD